MKNLNRDNADIAYTLTGEGDTTLLFVHGSYIDQEYWKSQRDYFSKNYKVVTIDLPGHGKSGRERKNWSFDGFAQDVLFVIKELELKNVILIGHSMAGDVNLIAATTDASNMIGFIAIDAFKEAATLPNEEFQKQIIQVKENLKKDFPGTNEEYTKKGLLTPQTPEHVSQRVLKDFRNGYQPMGLAITDELFENYKKEKELLPKLKLKLYIIDVDYYPINEEPLKQYAVNGYEILHLHGTSHFPMIEDSDGFNKALKETIAKIALAKK